MNEFARCPYRPPHSLIHHRLLGHIYKCEQTYPPLQVCPYNPSHILKTKADVKKHVEKCPTKNKQLQPDEKGYHLETCSENADGSYTIVLRKSKMAHYCTFS